MRYMEEEEQLTGMSEQVARLLFEQPNKCEVARPSKSRAEASEYVDCCTSTIDVAQTIGPTQF